MEKLLINDLWSLEDYALKRSDFRSSVLAHKSRRVVALGPNARLIFEDRITIQYQIQEMLRVERIFERAGIQEELDAYNPLIPDGKNLKATMLIEYTDVSERKIKLQRLKGVEKKIWVKVGDNDLVYPIADEDLEREDNTKTSAVHFLRWEFNENQIQDFKNGSPVSIGISHPEYDASHIIAENVRAELAKDFI